MAEALGGSLLLLSMLTFVVGLVALIRPIRRLKLGSRARAGGLMVASVLAFGIGASLLPPVPPSPASPSAPPVSKLAARPSAPAPAKPAPVQPSRQPPAPAAIAAEEQSVSKTYDFTPDDYLSRLNAMWSRSGAEGAFSLMGDQPIVKGDYRGGAILRACARTMVCVLITKAPAGHVAQVMVATAHDGSDEQTLDVMRAHIFAAKAIEPGSKELGAVIGKQFKRMGAGEDAEPEILGRSCVSVVHIPDAGIWSVIEPAPCSAS